MTDCFRRPMLAVFVLILFGNSTSKAEDCTTLLARFNAAVDAGLAAKAQVAAEAIATDGLCGRYQVPAERRLAAFRLSLAQGLMARGRPDQEFETLLVEADAPQVLWQAAATLAEVRFGERRFAEAAIGFDRAIEIVKNESLTPTPPSTFEILELIDRSTQARLLAASGRSGAEQASFVRTQTSRADGKTGGMYSPSVRGIVPHALPLPITFDYGKATLTAIGENAARELAHVIREQEPPKVTIVGHTDVRGDADLNVKLSKERAATIAAFLQQNGIAVPIETLGVGANEPLEILDTSGLTQEDIYALNRRVEWRKD